jgi:hypothetical protein
MQKNTKDINLMLESKSGRIKLACLMVPAIRAALEGCGDTSRHALFMKRTNQVFSKNVTWKDMEKHFGLKYSKVRRKYDNLCWEGWWA